MKILKVINNNVVSCRAEGGGELIAMGRGLGYGAHPGDFLAENKAEKIFRMDTQTDTDKLKDLLESLPPEQIELCSRIISYAVQMLGKPLSKTIYLTLTDHIAFAVGRMQEGKVFQNPLLTEVRIFYPREFAVGRHALELIRKELGAAFPDDEAASIALHLVNAEYDTSLSETMHITQALHDILLILKQWPGICVREESLAYDELTVHLKFLVMRTFAGEEETRSEPAFVHAIRETYPVEYDCAQAIARYLEKQSGHAISPEKRAYLAVHLCRGNNRKERGN